MNNNIREVQAKLKDENRAKTIAQAESEKHGEPRNQVPEEGLRK